MSTRYRLASTDLIHTPGLLTWLQRTYQDNGLHAIKVMAAGWPHLPFHVRLGLLDGSIPYTVDGTTVLVEVAR